MPRLTESNKRILGALLLVAGSATSMTSSASMLALHLGLGALASRGVRRQIEVKTPPRRLPADDERVRTDVLKLMHKAEYGRAGKALMRGEVARSTPSTLQAVHDLFPDGSVETKEI